MTFPFAAIVGQHDLRLALVLAAIEPRLGGVLAFGDRGTGKTTMIRALAATLPPISVTKGCPYGCAPTAGLGPCAPGCPRPLKGRVPTEKKTPPSIDLPLGSSEDRLTGALDIEKAMLDGVKEFQPGLLAEANGGFLYVDEINLLEDHLVDILLDVAASGENLVEKDGFSIRHPSRFVLIGSGNPEEGDLRPQLQDRFGLSVTVKTPTDIEERVEILRRRDAFEQDASGFIDTYKGKTRHLRGRITRARNLLDEIETSDAIFRFAADLCLALGSDGLRGELTLVRAARAFAAYEGRREISTEDVIKLAPMTLTHRLRRDPLSTESSDARIHRALAEITAKAAATEGQTVG